MMIPRKSFLYFLLDTPTGNAYYRTMAGNIAISPVTAGSQDVSLQDSPATWLETTLAFERNEVYHGINRSYSTPQEFVRDAMAMVQELFINGPATETPLTLAVFKYNSQPQTGEPTYDLYYKGNLDLSELSATVLESLSTPLMEGGIGQLLKSYENTVIEVPCDGSIPENVKVNLDGQLTPDVLYYQATPLDEAQAGTQVLAGNFVSNESDNYGIVYGNPTPMGVTTTLLDLTRTSNYLFYSNRSITIRIRGSIVFGPKNNDDFGNYVRMCYITDRIVTTTGDFGLVYVSDFYDGQTQQVRGDFDFTVSLQPNEKLFLMYFALFGAQSFQIVSGNFSISFNSAYQPTRPWAIRWFDLYKYIVARICALASTNGQNFNYEAVSELLDGSNILITSGDALRASGDPTYQRFYYINTLGDTSFGPVIKTTLKECFQSAEAHFCAALGVQRGINSEALFLESIDTVYDDSTNTFNLGEVRNLKWGFAKNIAFSDLSIGYPSQTSDQKSGKFEPNTTLDMKAPINSFEKRMSVISKYRADSYGIERLRSNLGTSTTSTTRNDSDNGVFKIDADPLQLFFDYYKAYFTSLVTDPDITENTNQKFTQNVTGQAVQLPLLDGEYFRPNLDQGIFVFSKSGYSVVESCNITVNGLLNSVNKPPDTPDDECTIRLWRNGVVLFEFTTIVTAVNTPITINQNFNQLFEYKDCIYVTASTTATGEVIINTATLTIGAYVSMSGANIPVETGTPQKVLSLGTVVPTSKPYNTSTSVVNYGYQYFVFNSIVPNTGFNLGFVANGFIGGQSANAEIEFYINGVLQTEKITLTGTVPDNVPFTASVALPLRNYALNDIVFVTFTPLGAILDVDITDAALTWESNYIEVWALRRLDYDSLQGIPNVATDSTGAVSTIVSGAPYNVEMSPKVMYRNWRNRIRSAFLDQVTGDMKFQTLSKNPYMRRTYQGVTIIEKSNEVIDGDRLFYPIEVEIEAAIPIGFAKLMSAVVNAHVHFTFLGRDFYFFPGRLSQKPALNEKQTLKGLISPVTDLLNFTNITQFRTPDMSPNSIYTSVASSVQFVPINEVLNPLYHTYDRDKFLFAQQIGGWFEKGGYAQPVQIGDLITLQHITRDLDPIFYRVFKCDGTLYAGLQNLNTIASPAISTPYVLWQYNIDTSAWDEGCYYIIISSTTAGDLLISECQDVRTDQVGTLLIEASSSFNTQGSIFDGTTPMVWKMRVAGFYDNRTQQLYNSRVFVNQGQDLQQLNAVPYEVMELTVAGVPDYVTRKLLRYLLMDSTTIEGEGFGLEEGATWEPVFTIGAPKKIQSIEIRPSRNRDGISVVGGIADTDNSLIVSVDAGAFGPNVSNASGTTDVDLIDIVVGN